MTSTATDSAPPDSPARSGVTLAPFLEWAVGQPLGSVIEYSRSTPSLELMALLDHGWRGLWVTDDPEAVSRWNLDAYQGRAVALVANLALTDDRLTATSKPSLLAAGIHPNQLYPLFAEPGAALPPPYIAIIDRPVDGFRILDVLSQWVRIEGFKLTVADDDEAHLAASWLSAGWRSLGVHDLTIWAIRAF